MESMDVFTSHRQLQSSSAFAGEVTPSAADGLVHFDNGSAYVIQSPQTHANNAQLLPAAQKLRPARGYEPDYANPSDNNLFSSNQGSEHNSGAGLFSPIHLQPVQATLPGGDLFNGVRSGYSLADYNHAAVNVNANDSFVDGLKTQIPQLSYSSFGSGNDKEPEYQSQKKRKTESSLQKQEMTYKQLMEALEKTQAESIIREQAWINELKEQVKREQEFRARVRFLISSLQNVLSGNKSGNIILDSLHHNHHPIQPQEPFSPSSPTTSTSSDCKLNGTGIGGGGYCRWPKSEVLALIKLRIASEKKFSGAGSKCPVWEDISAQMARMGYSWSAKKCKEKWQNVNKYYKKICDSGKKRPENAKCCSYFHELEAFYREELDKSHVKSDIGTDLGREHQRM